MPTALDQFDAIFGRGHGVRGNERPLPVIAINADALPTLQGSLIEADPPSSNFLLRFFDEGGPRVAAFFAVGVALIVACALVELLITPLPLFP